MRVIGRVQGSEEQAKPVVIGKTTVYVHSNITPVEKTFDGEKTEGLYEYDEVQYTKDEWIEMLTAQGKETNETLDDILTNVLPAIMEGVM